MPEDIIPYECPDPADKLFVNDIDITPWTTQITVFIAGAAGRGPPAPEAEQMSTESSIDHPSVIDDLDTGDSEAVRTKMTFAKMQAPAELRDSYIFDDRDFDIPD